MPLLCPCPSVGPASPPVQTCGQDSCFRIVSWDVMARVTRRCCSPRKSFLQSSLCANRLDVVAVGVDQERGKIARAVVGPRAGRAVVAASGLDALAVEFADRGMV